MHTLKEDSKKFEIYAFFLHEANGAQHGCPSHLHYEYEPWGIPVLTVVWNDYLLIFDKNVIFTSQEVGNPVQIIKNVKCSRFQPILKNPVTFV